MKQSVQFSDSIHIMVYLATISDPALLKSSAIADSVKTNASNVRKIMGQLRRAGLVTSQQGKVTPQLAKPATEISLLDIFNSLEGENPLLMVDRNTNQDCPVGKNVPLVLNHHYQQIQKTFEQELEQVSLAQIVDEVTLSINQT